MSVRKQRITEEFEGYEKTKEQFFRSMSEDIRKEYVDNVSSIGGGEQTFLNNK